MTTRPEEPWVRVHEEAVQRGDHTYIDPTTGALVMTELAHASRGVCCGSGCRHCPWSSSDDAGSA